MVDARHVLVSASLSLCATMLPAQARGLRGGETVEETASAFPGAEPKDANGEECVWCVRIIDAVDRRPIAGALVQVPWHPVGGVVDAEMHHQCVGRADEHGWVRLPWAAVHGYRDYVFADAPGYAANEDCQPGEEECALQRGIDVPVELVDYTGRPVPDARIELVLGCGHVPCQRSVIADARGRATLRDIWPERHEDFFVWAPQCQYGAYRLRRTWRPGDPPVPIDVVPGCAAAGRVVDAAGAPVVGARVGAKDGDQEQQRPWTRTDHDGRFRLVGLEAWQTLAVQPPPQLGLAESLFTAPPVGVERTIVLGKEGMVRVVAVAHDAAGGPAAEVRIVAVRTDDGFTATERTDDIGKATLALPAGRYSLRADGELGTFGRAERELDVGDARLEPVELIVPRNPTVHIDASRIVDMTLGITTAAQYRQLDPNEVNGKDVPVPAGERATFRISMHEADELLVRFVEIPGNGGPLVLEGPPATRVKARFVGPDGKPVPASLCVQRELYRHQGGRGGADEGATASAEITTHLTGTLTWVASPQDESLAQLHGDVVVRNGADTDLGEIRFSAPRDADLTVVLPQDMTDRTGEVRTGAIQQVAWGQFGEDGKLASGLGGLAAGDLLWIWPGERGAVPFAFRVPGAAPWTVHYPTSSLTVALRSAKNLSIADTVVIIDGSIVNGGFAENASLRLRGLAAGAHTLVVAERNHLAKVFRLVVNEDDDRALDVLLNPRD